MKEYIEKAVALEALSKSGVTCNMRAHKIVASIQAADVVEVRHGHWIFDHMTGEWSYYSHCSECNYQEFFANEDVEKRHKYCLNCGARMGK